MNRPTVTVAIIAQNEAVRLRQLLPRLAWANAVLVVDGGSTDDTTETVRSCGATVLRRSFDHFAAQRNAALDAAATEWVFFIDADETPSVGFADDLRRRLRRERHVGYRVPIRSFIFGRKFRFSGTQDDAPLRLVRRDAGRWSGAVHETFTATGPISRLDAHLDHETLPTRAAFLAKMHRYTNLAAAASVARGEAPRLSDLFLRPAREVFRRLIWKHGWLDGPLGWQFCLLSGYSEWVLARKQRRAAYESPQTESATAAMYLRGAA